MSINRFFQDTLGANLKNPRWSWGAVDTLFGRVYLKVWEDQIASAVDGNKVQVYWKPRVRNLPGYDERLQHIEAIKNGAQGFGVVCRARDPQTTEARKIADFQKSPLLELGNFTEDDRCIYAHITGYIPTSELARTHNIQNSLSNDLRAIISKKSIDTTTKEALVDARVGQGAFRLAVLQLWNYRCSVTGSTTLDAIRASHIKPWRFSTNEERLDPMNGLPLVASIDALFDAGLISFEDSGHILVSSELSRHEQTIYGVMGMRLTKNLPSKTANYLHYHRTELYRK